MAAVYYHTFVPLGGVGAAARLPLLNDALLHLIAVRRVAGVATEAWANASWSTWVQPIITHFPHSLHGWAPLRLIDHVLGGHGLGFPLFRHYQHLPHVATGVIGALLEVSAVVAATALSPLQARRARP